ncbi:MAG: hydrogenase formation protein HypD, partial [Streptomycetaceae bacterium]|nr:hydrogenase formation protein HypD [Streptomycetaceae bacterium]
VIGRITAIGLVLAPEYASFDDALRFGVDGVTAREHPSCIAGHILRGTRTPLECPAYASACTPRRPLGAPMVSAEGTCAAYYNAGRREVPS